MFDSLYQTLIALVGPDQPEMLTWTHMIARAGIIYVFGMLLVMFDKRFIGLRTSFDIVLQITIGSMFASIISGEARFFLGLVSVSLLVVLNWTLAAVAYYSKSFERLLKGSSYILVKDGKIQWNNMRKNFITQQDLMEAVRMNAHLSSLQEVEQAYLENDGEISIIPHKALKN